MKFLKVRDMLEGKKVVAYANPAYIANIVKGKGLLTPTEVEDMNTIIYCLPNNVYGSARDIEVIWTELEAGV